MSSAARRFRLDVCDRWVAPFATSAKEHTTERTAADEKNRSAIHGRAQDPEPDLDADEELDEEENKPMQMWNEHGPSGPELGGPADYEPTRYGDWAKRGRVSDF